MRRKKFFGKTTKIQKKNDIKNKCENIHENETILIKTLEKVKKN